jgi:hypothetical protein
MIRDLDVLEKHYNRPFAFLKQNSIQISIIIIKIFFFFWVTQLQTPFSFKIHVFPPFKFTVKQPPLNNGHLPKRPPFERPNFNYYNIDYLWTTAPVNNGHNFRVSRVAVVQRFDCTLIYELGTIISVAEICTIVEKK